MEPADGSLDHPAGFTQTAAVRRVAPGDLGPQYLGVKGPTVLVVIVTTGRPGMIRGFESGRPRFPRWVEWLRPGAEVGFTSLRLVPVRMTANGMPCASVIRWCLEPGRARSVGLGPVFDPHPQRERRKSSTMQRDQSILSAVRKRASSTYEPVPRHRPLARREPASNSCPSRSPFPGAASPRDAAL